MKSFCPAESPPTKKLVPSGASTARTATLTAFLIARELLLPCEMMLTPLTPRSGAPPCSE